MSANIISGSSICKINKMNTFSAIEYYGKDLKFNKIEWHDLNLYPERDHVDLLKSIIKNDGEKICKSKKTKEL